MKVKRGDLVRFIKPYRHIVQAGEVHSVDKVISSKTEIDGIYIKLDFTYIYLDFNKFKEYCLVIAKKDAEIALGKEYIRKCEEIDKNLIKKMILDKIEELEKDNFCEKVKESRNLKEGYDYINPSHYRIGTMETFDMMVMIWGKEKAIAHCEMTAFKYRMRAGRKPEQPIERDMEKAKWYENKATELKIQLENEQNT